MLAPSRTPRALIKLLSTEIGRILDLLTSRSASRARAPAKSSTPEAFDKLVRDEIVTRRKV
jgi:hypothetical protein